MPRTIALCSALFWMTSFGMEALGQSRMAMAGSGLPEAALALADALAAAMFAWMALTVLFEASAEPSDVVIRSAFSVGGAVALLALVRDGAPGHGQAGIVPAITFAALMASYAATHAEKRAVQEAADDGELDDVRRAARRMAWTAAQTILAGRIGDAGPRAGLRPGLAQVERDNAA